MQVIFDDRTLPAYVKTLLGQGSPKQGLADATVQTVALVIQKAEAEGQKIPGDVLFAASKEVLEELADLSKEAGVKDYSKDPDPLDGAFFQAVDDFRMMMQQNRRLNPETFRNDMGLLRELDHKGGYERMLRGLAANKAAGEKRQPSSPSESEQVPPTRTKRTGEIVDFILNDSWPTRLVHGAFETVKHPGDVYAGRIDPLSDEGLAWAMDLAGMVTLGAGALPRPSRSLTAGAAWRTPKQGRGKIVVHQGRKFLTASNGTIDFGFIRKEVCRATGGQLKNKPIRMELGRPSKDGYGAEHLAPDRHARARELGYHDAIDMAEDVARNHDLVVRQGNGRVMLVKQMGTHRYGIVEIQEGPDAYYGFTTTFSESRRNAGKPHRTSLYSEVQKRGGKIILVEVR